MAFERRVPIAYSPHKLHNISWGMDVEHQVKTQRICWSQSYLFLKRCPVSWGEISTSVPCNSAPRAKGSEDGSDGSYEFRLEVKVLVLVMPFVAKLGDATWRWSHFCLSTADVPFLSWPVQCAQANHACQNVQAPYTHAACPPVHTTAADGYAQTQSFGRLHRRIYLNGEWRLFAR